MDTDLRTNGIYEQTQTGLYMLRVKVPGGILTTRQARALCAIADQLADRHLHLTTRMSVEFHGIPRNRLEQALARLEAAGLTSRGACGGTVRGVAVSTPGGPGRAPAVALARRIHARCTGNPEFEGLPKKFKIGVDAGYDGARHLIQDVGLVYAGSADGTARWDVWLAGGLGRAPAEGLPYASALPEDRILPVIGAVVRVYRRHVPSGKRLKHLVASAGREAFFSLVNAELTAPVPEPPQPAAALPRLAGDQVRPVVVRVFAGDLPADRFHRLAGIAEQHCAGQLTLLPSQDVALHPASGAGRSSLEQELDAAGWDREHGAGTVAVQVCPGSHTCPRGLAPTRDVARRVLDTLGPRGRALSWAVCGCPNACAQPQVTDAGVLCSGLTRDAAGDRTPRFDLLRRDGPGLGRTVVKRASLDEILEVVAAWG